MTEKLLSIIVPVYNVAPYIEKCIQSILGQTYRNLELIIVDDGSKDETGRLCDEFAKKDTRIKVIHKENEGVSAARNTALHHVRGEYIAFVDGDDYVDSWMYEKMTAAMEQGKHDIVICGYVLEDEKGQTISRYDGTEKTFSNSELLYEVLLGDVGGYLCNKLFKRSIMEACFDESIDICEDKLFLSTIMRNASLSAAYVLGSCYHYVKRKDSATQDIGNLFDADGGMKYLKAMQKITELQFDGLDRDIIDKYEIKTKLFCVGILLEHDINRELLHALLKDLRSSNVYRFDIRYNIKAALMLNFPGLCGKAKRWLKGGI